MTSSNFQFPIITDASNNLILPNSAPFYCSKVPDIDNLIKLVMDAFNKKLYKDDRAVVVLNSEQRWLQNPGSLYTQNQEQQNIFFFEAIEAEHWSISSFK